VAMTMDALRAGLRVVEIEVDLHHNATGKDLSGLLHRARQARAIARELSRRRAWRPTPNGADAPEADAPEADAPAAEAPPADAPAAEAPAAETPAAEAPAADAHETQAPADGGSPGWEGSRGTREGGGGSPQPPTPGGGA
jgi:hypothetical protein